MNAGRKEYEVHLCRHVCTGMAQEKVEHVFFV